MRIAIYHNLPSGGAKRHTAEQARQLAARGHELVEFCLATAEVERCPLAPFVAARRVFPFAPSEPAARIPGVTPYVHLLQGLALLRDLDRVQRQVANAIDQGGFDVALVQDCRLAMNPHILRHLATPSAFFCHHGFEHWDVSEPPVAGVQTVRQHAARRWYAPARRLWSAAQQRSERRNAAAAGVLLAASRFAGGEMQRRYGRPATVVGGGVDCDCFRPAQEPPGDYVLSVGELTPRKQHGFLVAALAQLAPVRRPRLVIAANHIDPVEAASVRTAATAAGVALEVETITDDRALVRRYQRARAFLYAPRGEMLGLACLEAMSCGVPVVAVGEGGVPEVVVDGETGWLVERDPRAFADRLAALLADPHRRTTMGAAAATHVRSAWTWAAVGDRLCAVLSRERAHQS